MFIVGLTGGIGTGKSTVAKIFMEYGVPVIDADVIAREVVEPGKPAWIKIRNEFGDEVFLDDGQINRAKLGEIIFSDVEKRKLLNQITHPYIHRTIIWKVIKSFFWGHQFVVADLPLLYETGTFLDYLHKIIVVSVKKISKQHESSPETTSPKTRPREESTRKCPSTTNAREQTL